MVDDEDLHRTLCRQLQSKLVLNRCIERWDRIQIIGQFRASLGMSTSLFHARLYSLPWTPNAFAPISSRFRTWSRRCSGGANLVFWVGDKAIGGKMFALVNLDDDQHRQVISYSAGPERYAELLEIEGISPAPYMARIHWVAVERWGVFRASEWEQQLAAAYEITAAKLPPKTRAVLALPAREQKRLIAERRKQLAAKEKMKSGSR